MHDPLRDIERAHLWRPYTDIATYERGDFLPIVRAEGVYLFTHDGQRLYDGISSWWSVALGHGEPRITDAITAQANHLQHSILGTVTHAPASHLAERLSALTQHRLPHVYFASDGSSVVDAALKLAAQYHALRGNPEKRRFIAVSERRLVGELAVPIERSLSTIATPGAPDELQRRDGSPGNHVASTSDQLTIAAGVHQP